ncbi:carbohydrate ABC transporter permease [Paenibacillus sp. S150]|uniref:carbohydrate ABC transporter permease n=1 Tax=Paenibacillus sp. S150 TaxID=2749826 RepID=UPI001C580A7B|nr:carbohydrate ABC transporter permease [Paenibacillus sp. S150]MBW4082526.1 carbohydrate ABC transporter permease [Paenibacillus sp. S150]
MKSRRIRKNLSTGLKTAVLCAFFIFFMLPIIWVVLTSVKRPVDQMAIPPVWIPEHPVFSSYVQLFQHPDFMTSLINSLLISGTATLITVIFGALAAYGIERFRIGGTLLPNLLLLTRMIPPVVVIVPVFLVAYRAHVLDTHILIIAAYSALNMALVIWLLRSFFAALPADMEEAAMIDGCSRLTTFWRIVLPVVMPGIAATALICFIFCWNEFLFAVTLTGQATKTMPVLTSTFVSQKGLDRGLMSASGVISSLPVILLTVFFQRYLVSGLTQGSVK